MIPTALHTAVTASDDSPGCPIPGRTRCVTVECGFHQDPPVRLFATIDKVDGDVSLAIYRGDDFHDGDLSLAIYRGDDFHDGPCLTKETALALCATLKAELEKL